MHGWYIDYARIVYGLCMDWEWVSMDCARIVKDYAIIHGWIVHGLCKDYERIMHGLWEDYALII